MCVSGRMDVPVNVMRKFLVVLGSIALTGVAIAAIAVGLFVYKGIALSAESRYFVDMTVPKIIKGWTEQDLLANLTPELRETVKPGQYQSLSKSLFRLGRETSYEGARGEANVSYATGIGRTVSASYVARAMFENGEATFRFVLLKRNGRWLIHKFHVDAKPFRQTANCANTGNDLPVS